MPVLEPQDVLGLNVAVMTKLSVFVILWFKAVPPARLILMDFQHSMCNPLALLGNPKYGFPVQLWVRVYFLPVSLQVGLC